MLDFCFPSQLYFVSIVVILLFSISGGFLQTFLTKRYKKKGKTVSSSWVATVCILAMLIAFGIAWLLNELCLLGYERAVILIVILLLSRRIYKLYQKNY